jgi:membrane protease YdiL (CAAX protease family)
MMDSENPETPSESVGITASEPAPRTKPEPWTFLDLFFFVLFFIAGLFVTFVAGVAVYAALSPLLGWHYSLLTLSQNTTFLLVVQFAFYVLILGYLYALVAFHYRLRFWKAFQWGPLRLRQILYFVAAGIVLTVAVQLAPTLLPDKSHFPLEQLLNSRAAAYETAIFAILFAPFMEELIFRGFLFSVFEHRIGLRTAIVTTAVLFAALHIFEYEGAWNHLLMIFFVGLALSLARGLTHKLAPSVVLHVTYNACLMIGLYFTSSHFRMLQSLSR